MAKTMYNKFVKKGEVCFDLTGDTVTPESLDEGIVAHDKTGAEIVGTSTKDLDTSVATAGTSDILAGKTAGVRGKIITGTVPIIGKQDIVISTKDEVKTIQSGAHDGSGTVTLDPVEKEKLVPENIRKGITLFEVSGSMTGTEGVVTENKTVQSSFDRQVVNPSPGKYLAEVVVEPISVTETPNAAGGTTITIG